MAYLMEDALEGVKNSRVFFLKHLKGATEEQWSWKPYAECKSLSETLAHLVLDDRMALYSLETGKEPDYEANLVTETDRDKLIAMLHESHETLVSFISNRFKDTPLDAIAHAWGAPMKVAQAIGYLSSEDYYHSGQAAFIRMATDPSWNYYAEIYGGNDQ